MDTFAIKRIKAIMEEPLPKKEKEEALTCVSSSLPSITSFMAEQTDAEGGDIDFSVDTGSLLQGLNSSFLNAKLSKEQLERFGFGSMEDLRELSPGARDNLLLGMKLFYLLSPVYDLNHKLDASCCAILFCKAMEIQMKDCFEKSLKDLFPDMEMRRQGKGRNMIKLVNAKPEELTLGAFHAILRKRKHELVGIMERQGKRAYGIQWWDVFEERLSECSKKRNQCCHAG